MKSLSEKPAVKYNEIIRILGEQRIERLYSILGSQRFSIAAVKNIIRRKKIINSIREGAPIRKIISQARASRRTIYRYMENASRKKVSV